MSFSLREKFNEAETQPPLVISSPPGKTDKSSSISKTRPSGYGRIFEAETEDISQNRRRSSAFPRNFQAELEANLPPGHPRNVPLPPAADSSYHQPPVCIATSVPTPVSSNGNNKNIEKRGKKTLLDRLLFVFLFFFVTCIVSLSAMVAKSFIANSRSKGVQPMDQESSGGKEEEAKNSDNFIESESSIDNRSTPTVPDFPETSSLDDSESVESEAKLDPNFIETASTPPSPNPSFRSTFKPTPLPTVMVTSQVRFGIRNFDDNDTPMMNFDDNNNPMMNFDDNDHPIVNLYSVGFDDDTMNIVMNETPTPSPSQTLTCTDYTTKQGEPWHDKDGDFYNCLWYATSCKGSDCCDEYDDEDSRNFGLIGKEACCVCGGGIRVTLNPTAAPESIFMSPPS